MRRLAAWAGALVLDGLVAIRVRLPEAGARRLAVLAARLVRVGIPSRRRIAERNLRRAFGDSRTAAERTVILRDAYARAAVNFSDILLVFGAARDRFLAGLRVEGREHLDAALGAGRGALVVSAHVGPFPLLAAVRPAPRLRFRMLYRVPKSPRVRELFARWLDRVDGGNIEDRPRDLAVRTSLEVLGAGGVVGLLLDQHYASGVAVPFFGHPAKTAAGAALLSVRSGAPLVPVRMVRGADGGIVLRMEPALPPPATRTRADLTACTAALTARIEAWIREDPASWFWVHRRWKDLDRAEDDAARAARPTP